MSELGVFCTVARTELKEKDQNVSDDTLRFLNYAIKHAYNLGLASAAKIAEDGSFLHDAAPDAVFGKQVAEAIRRELQL